MEIQFKVEKGRVLVPVGVPCPFGCKYCYTRNGEVGPARVAVEDILCHLQDFVAQHELTTLQFGYDSDPFSHPERAIRMLYRLAGMGKDINFSTKAVIEGETLTALADIQEKMKGGTTLSALISLSCWESAPQVEPHTPSPQERMRTVRNLKRIGVASFIAVRPILPHIALEEYEHLIAEGLAAECDGFILGPLYADEEGRFVKFIPADALTSVPNRKVTVSWSAHAPVWTRYEDEERVCKIAIIAQEKGGRVFLSSADAVTFAHRRSQALDRSRVEVSINN